MLDKGLTVGQVAVLLYAMGLVLPVLSPVMSLTADSDAGVILVLFCSITGFGAGTGICGAEYGRTVVD
jgi:hypothetical protein